MERIYRIDDQRRGRLRAGARTALAARSRATSSAVRATASADRGLTARACSRRSLPSKIVAVGLNYKDHAAEQGKPLPAEPLIFLKPSTRSSGRASRSAAGRAGRVDHEAELASSSAAARTACPREARGLHPRRHLRERRHRARAAEQGRAVHARQGLRHVRAVGPCIATGLDRSAAWRSRAGSTAHAGRQSSHRASSSSRSPTLVAFISAVMTLLPGDIISTGTPSGIGPLDAGRRSRSR